MQLRSLLRRLRRDRRGVAMVEFALGTPALLAAAVYGIECANYALTQLRVSQVALALADNASRVGISSSLARQQLREIDINDVLQAARKQGEQLNVTKYGRLTVSSLEADDSGSQTIHWQRCLGKKSGTDYDSHFGAASPTDGSDATTANNGFNGRDPFGQRIRTSGMGAPDRKVKAPNSSGVMFVEINYLYQPLFGDWLIGNRLIHYTASFIVRDRRLFDQIYNPDPQVAAGDKLTCDRYTA